MGKAGGLRGKATCVKSCDLRIIFVNIKTKKYVYEYKNKKIGEISLPLFYLSYGAHVP